MSEPSTEPVPAPQSEGELSQSVPEASAESGIARQDLLGLLRLVWPALVAVAAIAVFIFGTPSAPADADLESLEQAVATANANAEINNSSAQGAPQQSVVNGWQLADLQQVEIEANTRQLDVEAYGAGIDARNGALILIAVIGASGELLIRALHSRRGSRTSG